jgi:indole-3-glycerol phosphate synthase
LREALSGDDVALIAEAKHASPSHGVLRDPYDPAALAREYETAGARAISVLTEPEFFAGSGEHLRSVVSASTLPVLRKDFVVDAYQCWEAKAWGAAAVLLIAAALGEGELPGLIALVRELGMTPLVEIHSLAEAERALAAGADVVGVNNRDLATFRTDIATTLEVSRAVPHTCLLVSESGIRSRADVERVAEAGVSAVLVGEALVTAARPGAKARQLVGIRRKRSQDGPGPDA